MHYKFVISSWESAIVVLNPNFSFQAATCFQKDAQDSQISHRHAHAHTIEGGGEYCGW